MEVPVTADDAIEALPEVSIEPAPGPEAPGTMDNMDTMDTPMDMPMDMPGMDMPDMDLGGFD